MGVQSCRKKVYILEFVHVTVVPHHSHKKLFPMTDLSLWHMTRLCKNAQCQREHCTGESEEINRTAQRNLISRRGPKSPLRSVVSYIMSTIVLDAFSSAPVSLPQLPWTRLQII